MESFTVPNTVPIPVISGWLVRTKGNIPTYVLFFKKELDVWRHLCQVAGAPDTEADIQRLKQGGVTVTPTLVIDGQTEKDKPQTITQYTVVNRADDIMVYLNGDSRLWGCGKTVYEAIGSAVHAHIKPSS